MSTKDQRRPDSVGPMILAKRALHFTFWTSDNLFWPLGLLFKDLHDLTDTAHALRLWQELMAYQTRLPGRLPNLWMGIVNQPLLPLRDLQKMKQSWKQHGQSSKEVPSLSPFVSVPLEK